ncbi:MAG: two-component sensor histidine kinase [Halobacteriovoraceae bacterium]|nr:two-component sensor histidine kinase [Halobacteriovoraceae bacterium]MBC99405.1 two-component sensor histidine kinase [Halobacteriovoraceae bacterium]
MALGVSLFLYIHSYLKVNNAFREFVEKRNLNPDAFLETQTWVMILILSLLVTLIIAGVVLIFVYYQKMIQLYRMQQNFINGFTHELKTPIASLRLFLDTFDKHDLSRDQQKKYLSYMIRDTERLSDNVTQILNLARIEDKKYEATWQESSLYDFLLSWREKISYLGADADIIIIDPEAHQDESLKIEGERCKNSMIRFEPNLLPLVFMNLVNNAIIYNNSARPQVEIRLKCHRNLLKVEFKDNGVGIPPSEQKKVFKKFYQVKKSGKGSGIGLYLVQTVMKFHKGQVSVAENENKKGSTFTLSFPLIN